VIRRLLPHPLLSALLATLWLVLNQSLSPGAIGLGVALGLLLGKVFALLGAPRVRIRSYPRAARLLLVVVRDIVRSNFIVARLILRGDRHLSSGFVSIPLTLTDHHGLAVLACIITSTPGTIWVSYDPAGSMLLIHVLDLADEQTWIDTIQRRYERPLLEIFE